MKWIKIAGIFYNIEQIVSISACEVVSDCFGSEKGSEVTFADGRRAYAARDPQTLAQSISLNIIAITDIDFQKGEV